MPTTAGKLKMIIREIVLNKIPMDKTRISKMSKSINERIQ